MSQSDYLIIFRRKIPKFIILNFTQVNDKLEFEISLIIFTLLAIITAKGGDFMKQFYCKTKILSGAGSVVGLGELGIRRLLLVADPFFTKDGTAVQIAKLAKAEAVEIFDRVTPDPTTTLIAEGTALVGKASPLEKKKLRSAEIEVARFTAAKRGKK